MPLFSLPTLALDTSAGASACLLKADGSSAVATMNTPRAHSRELLPMLQGLLESQGVAWQDIGAFAVGVGPGSFTGLRVACATIAGINASLKKPVYSLSSLEITARQAGQESSFWAIEDARSGLVYAAQYEQGQCLSAPQCLTWDTWLNMQPKVYISMSDIPVDLKGCRSITPKYSREQALIEAVRAIAPDAHHAMWAEPLYLQPSQAEKNLT